MIHELPERRFAVRRHPGGLDTIEETRRPLYQQLLMHELVGGPPVLRFDGDGLEVLVGTTCEYDGDADITVERIPQGWFAVVDFEGPEVDLPKAREDLLAWCATEGLPIDGPVLQVHLMDTIEGIAEQQLQVAIRR